MSTELKQAAQQALEALETEQALRHGYSYLGGVRIVSTADKAIEALRTAIQQAESEPVLFVSPEQARAVTGKNRVHYTPSDNSGRYLPVRATPAGLFVQPLYTHPAPGVPEGFALVPLKATPKVAMVLYEGARNCFSPKVAEGLWQDALTAAQAQKDGG